MNVLLFRWLLPAATGLLYALALPPFNNAALGWIALVPLLFAVEGCGWSEAFRRGYIAGLVFFGLTVWWIIYVTWPGVVGFVGYLALYVGAASALFAILTSAIVKDGDSAPRNLLVATLASAGWVTLEWIRGVFLCGGFGWNGLAITQWQTLPLIQFSQWTGVYGVTALVCFVNWVIYFTARRYIRLLRSATRERRLSWELYVATALVSIAVATGAHSILHRPPDAATRKLRLAMVQGNIPQTLKFEAAQKPMILATYRALTDAALIAQPHPDLIIWPETATPDALRFDQQSYGLATNFAIGAGTYLLTGTVDVDQDAKPPAAFNGAALVHPNGTVPRVYHKMHLVPFGEYVPARKIVPMMKWLTPITDSFEEGREYTVFQLEKSKSGRMEQSASSNLPISQPLSPFRFGCVICFEDTLPELCRHFVATGVDFLVNVTNDAWFQHSPAAEMQLASGVFRTVENRRPLVRCTNNGITCIVDEYGIIAPESRIPQYAAGFVNCELSLPAVPVKTFYAQHGNVFVLGCVVVTSAFLAWRLLRRRPMGAE